jgi:hypothetical protein
MALCYKIESSRPVNRADHGCPTHQGAIGCVDWRGKL